MCIRDSRHDVLHVFAALRLGCGSCAYTLVEHAKKEGREAPTICLWDRRARKHRLTFVILSGLGWHFPGLSELPLEQRLLSITCRKEHFSFFFHSVLEEEPSFPILLFFVGIIFTYTYDVDMTMLSSIIRYSAAVSSGTTVPQAQHSTAQHSTAKQSTAAQHSTAQHSTAQHSTAQHSTVNPHKQESKSKQAPIRARQSKQAGRVGSSPHVAQHVYSSLCSQNERRNRNLPALRTKIYNQNSRMQGDRAETCLLYTSPSPRD